MGNVFSSAVKDVGVYAGDFARNAAKQTMESPVVKDVVVETITNGGRKIVDYIRAESASAINEIHAWVNPELVNTSDILMGKIAPEGGFFRTVFAKLLHMGATLGGYASAFFVDKFADTHNIDVNSQKLQEIWAWALGSIGGMFMPQSNMQPMTA